MWKAHFISESEPSTPEDPAPYFRKCFSVDPGLLHATMSVTALGLVEASVNGHVVTDDVLCPGWTTYDARLMVREYDVLPAIVEGDNVIGAVVGQGWAVGPFGFDKAEHHYADRPALFIQLSLEYADHVDVVVTSPDPKGGWRIGHGGVQANSLYDGEIFDARLEPIGWLTANFNDSTWAHASGFEWDLSTLKTPKTPPVRRMAQLTPVAISVSPHGFPIVDFGQNISGWVRLRVCGSHPGQSITIRHAEVLTPEGGLERETNRTAKATDTYVCAGNPEEQWEPRFTFHGFRYIEIEGWQGSLSVDDVSAVAIWSDMTEHGWFESSNALINRLHDNSVWSMRDNFVSIPTDCPQRDERLGWTGDLNAFISTAAYLYDIDAVVDSWLQDLVIAQRRVGNMPRSAPLIDPRPSQPTALWGDSIVNIPWTLFHEYGDLEILRRYWKPMMSFVDEVETLLSDEGLWDKGFQYGDWCDPDAPPTEPGQGKTDKYLVAQAFYARTTAQMALIAGLIGDHEQTLHYSALSSRVRQAFLDRYVTKAGHADGETSTGYALAICFGLLRPSQQRVAGQCLADIVASRGYIITSGFAGTPFVMDALTMTGHLDAAYHLLMQTRCPSFLYPVTMGATTTWERWDAILPDGRLHRTGMTSLNHYALGSVNDWIHRVVGGLSATSPGWTRLKIAPQPGGGLTWARTSHVTPQGLALVDWRITDGNMTLKAVVPDGCKADVILPCHPQDEVIMQGPGEHVWSYPLG